LSIFSNFKKDFSVSALIAGLIVVLVGMTSSAVIVFQVAQAFGATTAEAGSWLGSLCIGMSILTIYFSIKYKMPILMAWSTPGAVLLIAGASHFNLPQAIGAFLLSAVLVFIFGITGWFEKIIDRIPVSLTSALLAGVLLHFCLDAFSAFKDNPWLVGLMFATYLIARKFFPVMRMLLVLLVGIAVCMYFGLFKANEVHFLMTQFQFFVPEFSFTAFLSLSIPLFIVTMASQNLTGLAVMKNYQYSPPISKVITGIGLTNIITAFFGGFKINLAAITAAIAMGPEAHPDRSRRYVAAVISGVIYILIGLFAGTVTSLFAAFPQEMISAIAGFALLGTVASGLEKALSEPGQKEAAFVTFIIAASGVSAFGISSAFWALLIGLAKQYLMDYKREVKNV
jgi:benzoate membrane transport protein